MSLIKSASALVENLCKFLPVCLLVLPEDGEGPPTLVAMVTAVSAYFNPPLLISETNKKLYIDVQYFKIASCFSCRKTILIKEM